MCSLWPEKWFKFPVRTSGALVVVHSLSEAKTTIPCCVIQAILCSHVSYLHSGWLTSAFCLKMVSLQHPNPSALPGIILLLSWGQVLHGENRRVGIANRSLSSNRPISQNVYYFWQAEKPVCVLGQCQAPTCHSRREGWPQS